LDTFKNTRATFGISLTREIKKRSRQLAADEWRVILPDARLLVSRTAAVDKKLRVPHSLTKSMRLYGNYIDSPVNLPST